MATYCGGHKCDHCGMEIPIGANICPYCGENPDSPFTKADRAYYAYKEAERKAKRKARLNNEAADISQRGCLGYIVHKIWTLVKWALIIIAIILIVAIIGNA